VEHNGKVDKAIQDYSKAIELGPERPDDHFNRGLLYERIGLSDRSIADYSKAIELSRTL